MKKTFFFILITSFSLFSFCQITITNVNRDIESAAQIPYDSSINFLSTNVYGYLGQELYVNHKPDKLRKYGYDGFLIDFKKESSLEKSNVYKCCDAYNSKYYELAGKYFVVLDVIKDEKSEDNKFVNQKIYYLKLQQKDSEDIVYFKYQSKYEFEFPFITIGFFKKLKTSKVGKYYVIRGKYWNSKSELLDLKTGIPISNFKAGDEWKCVDVTIDDKYFSLSYIIENDKGEQILMPYETTKNKNWVFELEESEKYRIKFGDQNWKLILSGNVKIGMTKEMCEISWGKPDKINETITETTKTEQWVYSDNFLYFKNGLLTMIQ